MLENYDFVCFIICDSLFFVIFQIMILLFFKEFKIDKKVLTNFELR